MKKHLLLTLALSFVSGAFIFSLAGFAPVIGGLVFTLLTMSKLTLSPQIRGAMLNAIDMSGITGFAEENKQDLIATLINGLDVANDVMVQPNVKTKIKLPKLTVGDGFRPFSSTTEFGNGGDLKFTERELETKTGKRELLIDIRTMKDKYLAWRTNAGNGANKKFDDYDFAKFTWQQIVKNTQREINDETVYFGFDKSLAVTYDNGTAYADKAYVIFLSNGRNEYFQNVSGAATTAGQSPATNPTKWRKVTARAVVPGFGVIIDQIIAAGFAPTAIGAINDATTAVSGFKKMFRDMPIPYQNEGVIINCSFTDRDFLVDGLETNITKYTTPEVSDLIKGGLVPIPGTNYKGWAKPVTWLGGSRRLIAGPMLGTKNTNLYMGTDLLSDLNDIKTKDNLWTVEAGISADLGFQIADLGALRINDQK